MKYLPRFNYYAWSIVVVCAAVLISIGIIALRPLQVLSVGTSAPMSGYLWSDTTGWIDLNCLNTNSCGTNSFGFSVASDGTLSGYAWSENVGWVSANASDVTGCPSGTCTPKLVSGSFTGWIRVLSGGTSQSGSYDGFISLSGAGYGVTKSAGAGFTGFAWGDKNVGWVDFSRAALVASCAAQNICVGNTYSYQDAYCITTTVKSCTGTCTPAGCSEDLTPPTGTIKAQPSLVHSGGLSRIIWSSSDATSCTVTGTNGDSWSALASLPGGNLTGPITQTSTYTLSCTGNGGSVQQQTKVDIVPSWKEI